MFMDLHALTLSRVGTSIALVGEGKLKIFKMPEQVLDAIGNLAYLL